MLMAWSGCHEVLCLPRCTGVSQVVLGASKTRRSDFDRRIPSENKKSTGSWRDIGVVRSCTLHVFVLHRCLQLEGSKLMPLPFVNWWHRYRHVKDATKAECACSSRPRQLASPWTPLHTQFISKRKSAICLLILVVSDTKTCPEVWIFYFTAQYIKLTSHASKTGLQAPRVS